MSALWHSFREGGWVMYPVFAVGVAALGAAVRFAWRGEHQLLGFIRWALAALLAAGVFGFVVGMMMVFTASQLPVEPMLMARLVMQGTTEASNNLAAALMFVTLSCVGVAVGQRRFPRPNPSAVAR